MTPEEVLRELALLGCWTYVDGERIVTQNPRRVPARLGAEVARDRPEQRAQFIRHYVTAGSLWVTRHRLELTAQRILEAEKKGAAPGVAAYDAAFARYERLLQEYMVLERLESKQQPAAETPAEPGGGEPAEEPPDGEQDGGAAAPPTQHGLPGTLGSYYAGDAVSA